MRGLLAIVMLALAACGAKGPLKWPEGQPPAPPPGAEAPVSTEKMLTPPPEAAPNRVDDPVRKSEERGDDPFDIPPTAD